MPIGTQHSKFTKNHCISYLKMAEFYGTKLYLSKVILKNKWSDLNIGILNLWSMDHAENEIKSNPITEDWDSPLSTHGHPTGLPISALMPPQ